MLVAAQDEAAAKEALEASSSIEEAKEMLESRQLSLRLAQELSTASATIHVARARLNRLVDSGLPTDRFDAAEHALVTAESLLARLEQHEEAGTRLDKLAVQAVSERAAAAEEAVQELQALGDDTAEAKMETASGDDDTNPTVGLDESQAAGTLDVVAARFDRASRSQSRRSSDVPPSFVGVRAALETARTVQRFSSLFSSASVNHAFVRLVQAANSAVQWLVAPSDADRAAPLLDQASVDIAASVWKAAGRLAGLAYQVKCMQQHLDERGESSASLGTVVEAIATAEAAFSRSLVIARDKPAVDTFVAACSRAASVVTTEWLRLTSSVRASSQVALFAKHEALASAHRSVARDKERLRLFSSLSVPDDDRFALLSLAKSCMKCAQLANSVVRAGRSTEEVTLVTKVASQASEVVSSLESMIVGSTDMGASVLSDTSHLDFVFKADLAAGDDVAEGSDIAKASKAQPHLASVAKNLLRLRAIEEELTKHNYFINHEADARWRSMLLSSLHTATSQVDVARSFRSTLGVSADGVSLSEVRARSSVFVSWNGNQQLGGFGCRVLWFRRWLRSSSRTRLTLLTMPSALCKTRSRPLRTLMKILMSKGVALSTLALTISQSWERLGSARKSVSLLRPVCGQLSLDLWLPSESNTNRFVVPSWCAVQSCLSHITCAAVCRKLQTASG